MYAFQVCNVLFRSHSQNVCSLLRVSRSEDIAPKIHAMMEVIESQGNIEKVVYFDMAVQLPVYVQLAWLFYLFHYCWYSFTTVFPPTWYQQ